MAPKKRTFNSNIRGSRVKEMPVTESLADFELKNKAEMEIATGDDNKNLSNCETSTLDLVNDVKKEFDFNKKSNLNTIQSSSSNKLNHQLPKSSSSLNYTCYIRSIFDKVKKLQIDPFVNIYSITPEGNGVSAAAMSQNLSHFAYSFPHSHEFHLCARKSLSHDIVRNDLRNTWLNFEYAKNQLAKVQQSEKENSACISLPQEYIIGHNDDVSGLCFSSNGNLLLSCSLDGSVKVVSTTTYCVSEQYHGDGSVTDIDVDSETIMFMTANVLPSDPFHAVYLYNFERKRPIVHFSGHTSSIKCVQFHPNGLYVATAACDKTIKLWSVDQSKEVRCFKDEEIDHPNKIAFSPDGKYIASTHSRCVKIWDLATQKELKCLETTNSEPHFLNVCYDSAGNMLAAGGSDKKIHIWNIISDEKSETIVDYDFLKSEDLGKRIFSIKFHGQILSCITG